jgi:hypothetical protein
MDTQQPRLQLEELNSRITPSSFRATLPLGPDAALGMVHTGQTQHTQATTKQAIHKPGSATGNYTLLSSITVNETSNLQAKFSLTGSASITGVGTFNVTGFLHENTAFHRSRAGGHIALNNSQGMIVLQLVGPEQHAGAGLPGTFAYQIIGGTGAYHHLVGHGTALVTLTPNAGSTGGSFSIMFA